MGRKPQEIAKNNQVPSTTNVICQLTVVSNDLATGKKITCPSDPQLDVIPNATACCFDCCGNLLPMEAKTIGNELPPAATPITIPHAKIKSPDDPPDAYMMNNPAVYNKDDAKMHFPNPILRSAR